MECTNYLGGTIAIGASGTRPDNNTATANNGTLSVLDGANGALSSGSSITEVAGSTLGVVADAAAGKANGIVRWHSHHSRQVVGHYGRDPGVG